MIVVVYDALKNGPWREQTAFLIDDQRDPVIIGASVHRAFAMARVDVPQPDYDTSNKATYPSLEISGAKTRSGFMKEARNVGIQQQSLDITVTPYANRGARGGFTAIDSKARVLRNPDDRALGEAVLDAFLDAE